MRRYIFSFNYEENNINHYLTAFLEEREIDYFCSEDKIYADLFGTNTYYSLETEHIAEKSYEVYYNLFDTKERTDDRLYPISDRVFVIENPSHHIRVTYDNGSVFQIIHAIGSKDELVDQYMNRDYRAEDGTIMKAIKLEFFS